MLERFRALMARVLTPPARLFLSWGWSPDVVTWTGTIAAVVTALVCFPQGWLWQGALLLALIVVSDMIDGQMARLGGKTSTWGAFLDSTLDRLADAAVFGGVLLYFADIRRSMLWAGVTLAALVAGQVTSYIRARAEALDYDAKVGLAARADRLVIVLLGAFLAGLGVPWTLEVAVAVLTVLGTITVGQRMAAVHAQASAADQARRG